MSNQNIVITGFMATGKSTVAPVVAEKLGLPFVEMDREIEKEAGWVISEIFDRYGEEYFRKLEHELCRTLSLKKGLVIATGGGTLVNYQNLMIMMRSGFVVCLQAPPDIIEHRLKASMNRPLSPVWRKLYEQRQDAYALIPNQIDVTNKSTEQISEEIIQLWKSQSN